MRILIVKLGAVGDVVHTLLAYEALRAAYPDARIGWVVEDKSVDVLIDYPGIERFVFRRRKTGGGVRALGEYVRVARELRRFAPDVAIDFQALFKSGALARLSGAKRRIGFDKWREGNFLFTNERAQAGGDQRHAVEKNFALLTLLEKDGVAIPDAASIRTPLRFALGDAQRQVADRFFAENARTGVPVVAVNPGASWPTKRWPTARYGTVCGQLAETGALPVVIWGPGEREMADEVIAGSGGSAVPAPKTSIRELAAFLARCDLYLGGDTGPMHIAAAVGTPVVALFAPSDPARVHPWGVPYRIVTDPDCHHCWDRKTCAKNCINKIETDAVVDAARNLLAEACS